MARTPKPWFRKDRQTYSVIINGVRHTLGPDKKEADRRFHELMAKADLPPATPVNAPPAATALTAVGVFDRFLSWAQAHRSPRTYRFYRDRIQSFVDAQPAAARGDAAAVKPFHVQEWVDAKPTWGAMQRRGAITSVQRAFAWAETMGHVVKSPVRHVEKPPPARREQVLDAAEFARLLAAVKDECFRGVLEFCWETGVRVQEVRVLEAGHFRDGRFEIPPAQAKGKKRWRVVHLTPRAAEIAAARMAEHPAGPLFRNEDGKRWTAAAFNCRFCRLQKKLGVKYALTAIRHSFCQRMLEAGMDAVTLAAIMGHVDAVMISRVYSHMNRADGHLRAALNRCAGA